MSGDQNVRLAVGAPDGLQSAVWLALVFGDRPDEARVFIDLHTGDRVLHSNPPR
jgi:hypothetical protein